VVFKVFLANLVVFGSLDILACTFNHTTNRTINRTINKKKSAKPNWGDPRAR